ncbi:MAG: peptidase, partial [Clostridioides difficile]
MYPVYGGFWGFDPTMVVLIPAILLTIYAQFKVSSTTNKYLRVNTRRGYT